MTLTGLLRLARPYRLALAALSALMLVESALTLVVPWLGGRLAGDLLTGIDLTAGRLVPALLAVLALLAVMRAAIAITAGRIGLAVFTDLRTRLFDHVIALPLAFHLAARQGDTLSLVTWEVGRLSTYLTRTLAAVLPNLVTVAGAVALMASIDPVLALAVPVLVPVFFLLAKLLGRRLREVSTRVQQAEAAAMATADQALSMLPAIKTFTREDQTAATWRADLDRSRGAQQAELAGHARLQAALQFLAGAAAVVLLALAGRQVAQGNLQAADTISFLLYAAVLTRPVAALADVWGRTQVARGTLARLGAVLDMAPEPEGGLPLTRALGALALHGLQFAWPGRPALFAGLHLTIAAGEVVALTGPNGAGKSTLTALLMRLMPPGGGTVTLDGQDIAALRLPDLRRQFGHVPQRPLLFNGTIRDNIAFGLPGATDAQVQAAARAAAAHDMIAALPDGYDTLVGDHGVRLSGGQGQRVALARALLKDPPVLILDEATAMYDIEGESAFVDAARTAFAGRTVILITHRPATLALAHRVLRLEAGRLT